MTESPRMALVGLACEYPDASTPWQLWENAITQRRSFRVLPPGRLGPEYTDDDPSAPDLTYGRYAAVLADYSFDRVGHNVSGATYRSTDLTQWLALDVTGRALNDFGADRLATVPRDRVGVVIGNSLGGEFSRAQMLRLRWPYVRTAIWRTLDRHGLDRDVVGALVADLEKEFKSPFAEMTSDSLAGGLANVIAGRICNHFDFHGGGFTVDGACASSLLSMIQGAQALERGDIDLAVVGGVDLSLDPFELVGFAKASALSPDLMRVYDTRSRGFWPGEGCGIALLMREDDALRLDCTIYAILGGWGISSDGSGGTTRPEEAGQVLAINRAWRKAGWQPDSASFYEGHGTGTPVGDATELAALAAARGRGSAPALIGSVKANIGHTKAAAGIAGVIKTALSLYQHTVPPITGCESPAALLREPGGPLRVSHEPVHTDPGATLRAGASSMGFGGINAHLALEAVPRRVRRIPRGVRPEAGMWTTGQDAELLAFAAADRYSLIAQVRSLTGHAARLGAGEVRDLAIEMARRNPDGAARAAVVVEGPHDTPAQLDRLLERILADTGERTRHLDPHHDVSYAWGLPPARIGLLFPGQAAPIVAGAGAVGRRLPHVTEGLRFPLGELAGKAATEVVQPAIVAASVAGIRALDRLGITADAAVGHSVGELAALHWGGWLADPAAVEHLAAARGAVMADHCSDVPGAMCDIRADEEQVQALIAGLPVVIAAYNGLHRIVVAGPATAIAQAAARAQQRGLKAAALPVSHAFHSPLMSAAVEPFRKVLARLETARGSATVISTITGEPITPESDIKALLAGQLEAPVRFEQAVRRLAEKCDLLLEVGPGRVFAPLAAGVCDRPAISLDIGSPSFRGLLAVAGAAFVAGARVNLSLLAAGRVASGRDPLAIRSFLRNPCQELPVPLDAVDPPSAVAASTGAVGDHPGSGAHAEDEGKGPGDPLSILIDVIAARAELPVEAVTPTANMIADLGLNSLTVAELVAEAAARLGARMSLAPNELIDATVADIAELLTAGDTEPTDQAPGVDTWVRCFTTQWLPEHPSAGRQVRPVRLMTTASSDTDLVSLFTDRGRAEDAPTAVVVAPGERTAAAAADFIGLLTEAVGTGLSHIVVLHRGDCASVAKSLAYERPDLTLTTIAVPKVTAAAGETAARLTAATRGFVEWRIDADGSAYRAELAAVQPVPSTEATLGAGDVVLVTGGGKGIGAECAVALARAASCQLALVGRTRPEESPELRETLAVLEATGISHRYHIADLTRPVEAAAVVRRVEDTMGPVAGVLHAAGINVPGRLEELSPAQVAATIATKVESLRTVLGALRRPPRFVVGLGSIIGRLGMHGEAHYALANEWLAADLTDLSAARPDVMAQTQEWSVWSGAGMGKRLPFLDSLARLGVTPIPLSTGLNEFTRHCLRPHTGHGPLVITSRFGRPPTLPDPRRRIPILRFLETPGPFTPGVELVCDSEVSWDTDPYLAEHVLEGRGLFPAVMALEAMAQATFALTGSRPTAFTDVTFAAPLLIAHDKGTTVRVAALHTEPGLVRLAVRSAATGFAVDHVTASASVPADSMPIRPVLSTVAPPTADRPPELYEHLLFHGPMFQRLARLGEVHAERMVGFLAAPAVVESWFSTFLPAELLLGDPGMRDAFMHAAQATIPRRRFVPHSVERIDLTWAGDLLTQPLTLVIEQIEHSGRNLRVNATASTEAGEVVEAWEGLLLRELAEIDPPAAWSPLLLGPLLERQLEAAGALADMRIGVASDHEQAATARETALERATGRPIRLTARSDGKPEPIDPAGPEVALSHGGPLVVAMASHHRPIAVDVEPVRGRASADWSRLLGPIRFDVARACAQQCDLPLDVAGTLVWMAGECLIKAGIGRDAPLVLAGNPDGDTVLWRSGASQILTTVQRVHGCHEPVGLAVLTPGAAGHPAAATTEDSVEVRA